MSGNSATASDEPELNENVIRLFGVVSGVMNFVALTAVSYFLFESDWLVFGVIVGFLSGVGSFFFIPWILQNQQADTTESAESEFSTETAPVDREESGGIHPVALGFGLEAAGIGMLAGRLVLEDIVLGSGVGIAVGLVAVLVVSIAFQYGSVK